MFQDLKNAVDKDTAAEAAAAVAAQAAAQALAQAEHDDAQAKSTLAQDTLAFASAIHLAGGFIVDTSTSPVTLYQSQDGQTVTSQPIPTLGDSVPGSSDTGTGSPSLSPAAAGSPASSS